MNWEERYVNKNTCPHCNNVGWVLISNEVKKSVPRNIPISMELHPCVGPECTVTGRDISNFSLRGNFAKPVMHPGYKNVVMSVESLPVENRTDDYSWRTQ